MEIPISSAWNILVTHPRTNILRLVVTIMVEALAAQVKRNNMAHQQQPHKRSVLKATKNANRRNKIRIKTVHANVAIRWCSSARIAFGLIPLLQKLAA
jgi:hypothetical protein